MALAMRQRLLLLSKRDYRPHAWRRRPNVALIIEQLRNIFNQRDLQYGTTTKFTMPVVRALDEALQTGRLLETDLQQVIERIFQETVVVQHRGKATRPIAEWAIVQQPVPAIAAAPAGANANAQAGAAGGQ